MAFDDLSNVDFTGEVRAQTQSLFATDAYNLCRLGDNILKNGPEGVAKAAQKKILGATGNVISSMTQTFAKQFNYAKTLQLEIGGYTTNITLKIDGAQKILDLLEGGKLVGPEGIDYAKLKDVLSNLDPQTLADGISQNFNQDTINSLIGDVKDSVFSAKKSLTNSLTQFTNNGALNAKKSISLQGLCNAAASNSFELGLKTAIARQLNTMAPDLSLGEVKVLTEVLL